MITALRIGNFKAFAEPQTVPIKPLTLIFGANSAGKSSIIHGLLLAHEANRTGNLNVLRTELGGDSVDLGGFRQYTHRHQDWQPVHWGVEMQVAALSGRLAELLTPARTVALQLLIGVRESSWEVPEVVETLAYDLVVDEVSLLRASRRKIEDFMQPTEDMRLDRIDHHHAVIERILGAIVETSTTATKISASDLESVAEAVDALVPALSVTGKGLLPNRVTVEATSPGDESRTLFPVGKGSRHEDLAAAVRFVLPRTLSELIGGLSEVARSELGRLRYLGPLRSYPPRHLASDQYHDPNWLAGGGHAYEVLRTNESVRSAVNRWLSDPEKLSTPYEVRVEHLVTVDDLELAYARRVESERDALADVLEVPEDEAADLSEWKEEEVSFDHLRELEHSEARLQVLHLVDKRTETQVTHRDVGIGISQVLPVLVSAYGSSDLIVAIEQPEIHLHPALQAELADVFIDSALGERKNTFLLETHSEHLILRVMRRMRDTVRGKRGDAPPVRPEDVAVLFVEPTTKGSIVHELRLKPDGSLLDPWPGGFFEEGFGELFG